MNKKGLGRGLEHLFEQSDSFKNSNESYQLINLSEIKPNPYQPRKNFNDNTIEELALSIKKNGVFQPILVRRGIIGYEIISGERRYKACLKIDRDTIPAIIYDFDDKQMMEVALVENIQREDLNIMDEANSYAILMEKLEYTQEKLSENIGKSRSHIANLVRLLTLNEFTKTALRENEIKLGHAKILLTLEDKKQTKVVERIIEEKLSVRELEKILKEKKEVKKEMKKKYHNKLEGILREKLESKVEISGNDTGNIKIEYTSRDNLEDILEKLGLI